MAVTAASFVGYMGFTIAMPFLPLYIEQLGVTSVAAVAWWSGVCLAITPAVTALLSPFWGRFADRYGKKIMIERSLISFVFFMALSAFVTDVRQLFAIRLVQGLFAGYGSLSIAMAAESAPPERLGPSIGAVQTAQRLGPAIGPAAGGLIAHVVGLRMAFLITAALYAVALGMIVALYRQPRALERQGEGAGRAVRFRNVLAFENFMVLMAAIFLLQFVDRSIGPILPLYLPMLGVASDQIALVAGMAFSAVAVMAAVGHHLAGRLLHARPPRPIIAGGAVVAALGSVMAAGAGRTWHLMAGSCLFGVGIGSAMTAAYTAGGALLPEAAQGTGFGLLTSASLIGMAASPFVAGVIAGVRLRTVFVVDAIILGILVVLISRAMTGQYFVRHTAAAAEVP